MTETRTAAPAATLGGRWALVTRALQVGLALQVVCLVLPLLDLWVFGTVEAGVRAAYPQWSAADVSLERGAIVGALVGIAVLGVAAWLFALRAVSRGRRARGTVTTLFVVGLGVLGWCASLGGGAYDLVVPPWLGLTLVLLPGLPGLTAVVAAWTAPRR